MSRLYHYVGPAEILASVGETSSGTIITNHSQLTSWLAKPDDDREADGTLITTFVIDPAEQLRLAPRRSEHVACAGGGPVLSAGEMTFSASHTLIEVSNQSTGFCPEPESWPVCESVLDRLQLTHPGRFTREVVFRMCPRCQERNVVKDDWYFCGLCDAELPSMWNFPDSRSCE